VSPPGVAQAAKNAESGRSNTAPQRSAAPRRQKTPNHARKQVRKAAPH